MTTEHKIGIGKRLEAAREARGWTVAEAANKTKLRPDAIRALEEEEFDQLPSLTYARGFIRLYARELGLDGKQMIRELDGLQEDSFDLVELRPEDLESIPARAQPAQLTPQSVGLVLLCVLLLSAGILAALSIGQLSKDKVIPMARSLTDLIQPMGSVDESAVKKMATEGPVEESDGIPVARAVPAGEIPVARAVPVGEVPLARAVPADEVVVTPVAVAVAPSDPAATVVFSSLQLYAAPGTPEEKRWVRITAENGGVQTALFAGYLPEGKVFPSMDEPAWNAEAFVIVMADTAAIDIIFNGQNYGKFSEPGAQQFRIPGVQP
jgi:cytoskeleton protein RodZ